MFKMINNRITFFFLYDVKRFRNFAQFSRIQIALKPLSAHTCRSCFKVPVVGLIHRVAYRGLYQDKYSAAINSPYKCDSPDATATSSPHRRNKSPHDRPRSAPFSRL